MPGVGPNPADEWVPLRWRKRPPPPPPRKGRKEGLDCPRAIVLLPALICWALLRELFQR